VDLGFTPQGRLVQLIVHEQPHMVLLLVLSLRRCWFPACSGGEHLFIGLCLLFVTAGHFELEEVRIF
jgi:hypothetical protein